MIYSKENISIAVEILQNLYHPNYNVPIEVVADAMMIMKTTTKSKPLLVI